MQEGRGETPCISSSDEVGALFEFFFLLTNSCIQKKYEMENISMHSPSQRVTNSIQSVPCIDEKW